jgi:hypothetical protein
MSTVSVRTQVSIVLGFCFGTAALISVPLLYDQWRKPYRDEVAFLSNVLNPTNTSDNLWWDLGQAERAAQMLGASSHLSQSESNVYHGALQVKRVLNRGRCRALLHQHLLKLAGKIELREWTAVYSLFPELRSLLPSFTDCGEGVLVAKTSELLKKVEALVLEKAGIRPKISVVNAPTQYHTRRLSEVDVRDFFISKLRAHGLVLVDSPQISRSLVVTYQEVPDTTDTYTLHFTYDDRRPESRATELNPVHIYCGVELHRADGTLASRHSLKASSPTKAGESREILDQPRKEIARQISAMHLAMSSDPGTPSEIQPHLDAIQAVLKEFPLQADSAGTTPPQQ